MTESDLIKNHISKLCSSLESSSLPEFQDAHLFGAVCVQNEFFEGDQMSHSRWDNTFTDSGSDGGIDWICAHPLEDNVMHFVQSKFVATQPASTTIAADIKKLVSGSHRLESRDPSLNEKVKNVFNIQEGLLADGYQKQFHLFYACSISEAVMDQAYSLIKNEDSSINFIVYTKEDIEGKILMNVDENPFVVEAKIDVFKVHGHLEFEKGVVLNVSAKSLRRLFEEYKHEGLFAQNLRKFIKKTGVDSSIDNTINHDRGSFWERNNGIIITCESYTLDGNNIKLYKFSIVNGCQTTNRIGRISGSDQEFIDFLVLCKIIPCQGDANRIDSIAEASNKQKAIKDEDLKANSREQKELRTSLLSLNPPVSLQIKAGESHPRNASIKAKNKALGQLILACFLQKPGTARSATAKIFGDESTYQAIFLNRSYDPENYRDLLELENLYKRYQKKGKLDGWNQFSSVPDDQRQFIAGLSSHAKYFILAFTVLMIKIKKQEDFDVAENLAIANLDLEIMGPLFNLDRSDEFESKLHILWDKILLNILDNFRNSLRMSETTGTSNYCKTDLNYRSLIPRLLASIPNSISFMADANAIMDDVFNIN